MGADTSLRGGEGGRRERERIERGPWTYFQRFPHFKRHPKKETLGSISEFKNKVQGAREKGQRLGTQVQSL